MFPLLLTYAAGPGRETNEARREEALEDQEAAANWAHSDFAAGAPERAAWGAFVGACLIGLVIFNPAGSERPSSPR